MINLHESMGRAGIELAGLHYEARIQIRLHNLEFILFTNQNIRSVSARVRFLRFWRNKLTADSLSVRFSWCTQKQQRERNFVVFMSWELRTSKFTSMLL